jgi:hypothetical protein
MKQQTCWERENQQKPATKLAKPKCTFFQFPCSNSLRANRDTLFARQLWGLQFIGHGAFWFHETGIFFAVCARKMDVGASNIFNMANVVLVCGPPSSGKSFLIDSTFFFSHVLGPVGFK